MIQQAGDYVQVAWVVDDLEAAMQRWLMTARVGPFFVNAHIHPGHVLYRGRPTAVDYSVALAQAGAIQIELIEQHNDEPSVYQEHGPGGAGGVHHMACFAPDFDAELAHLRDQGIEVVNSGMFGDMRFVYGDTRRQLGFMTEVLENKPTIHRVFAAVAEAAKDWNRDDPIRDLRSLL